MQTATITSTNNPAISLNQEMPTRREMAHLINRAESRVIFFAGDMIVPQDKVNSPRIAFGGEMFSADKTPCLWETSYMVYRGMLTPLQKCLTPAHSDMRKEGSVPLVQGDAAGPDGKIISRNHYEAFPGYDMQLFLSDDYAARGYVEIRDLMSKSAEERLAAQLHFIPDWLEIQAGRKSLPRTLRGVQEQIEDGLLRAPTPELERIGNAMLFSCTQFRAWGEDLIAKNRDMVEQGVNIKGFSVGWKPLTRHVAAQLEIALTPELELRNAAHAQLKRTEAQDSALSAVVEQLKEQSAAQSIQTAAILELLKDKQASSVVSGQSPVVGGQSPADEQPVTTKKK